MQDMSGQYPCFCKILLRSHISDKFYLGLPKKFCDAHLAGYDNLVILVDENEQEYTMKYSTRKNRLHDGWRGFATDHYLMEGDTLSFHLIERYKFKVHIVRTSSLREHDIQDIKPVSIARHRDPVSLVMDGHEVKKKARLSATKPAADPSASDEDIFDSNLLEGINNSEPILQFKDVKGLDDFQIQVNGVILDSQIPPHIRTEYYDLCCSQKMFLHDRLIMGLSSKLSVAIISETTDIADAIRATNLATFHHHFEYWEKSLKAFEELGMEVGFLCARLHKLVSLSLETQAAAEFKKTKRALISDQKKVLQEEVLKLEELLESVTALKASVQDMEAEVDALDEEEKKERSTVFKEVASSPW